MSWIRSISYEESAGVLRDVYDRIRGKDNYLDNIVTVHGLRPHTLTGHMELYKSVLHHTANQLPEWLLEAVGVVVSRLNECDYCVQHHSQGLRRLLGDQSHAESIISALEGSGPHDVLDDRVRAMIHYAEVLTLNPQMIEPARIDELRAVGLDDGDILELNQVISYFAYANRTVLGLGVITEGDRIGLSPGNQDDPDDWRHA